MRKMMVRLDKNTIPSALLNEIENQNPNLNNSVDDIYEFEFNESMFPSLILSNNQTNFGRLGKADHTDRRKGETAEERRILRTR